MTCVITMNELQKLIREFDISVSSDDNKELNSNEHTTPPMDGEADRTEFTFPLTTGDSDGEDDSDEFDSDLDDDYDDYVAVGDRLADITRGFNALMGSDDSDVSTPDTPDSVNLSDLGNLPNVGGPIDTTSNPLQPSQAPNEV